MPAPYPNDPTGLPPFFPDGECVYTTYVNLESCNNQRHDYEVKLRHFDPEEDDPFLTWEILIRLRGTNDQFQLGCLSIDRVLYSNQEPATFTGSFILNELKNSMDLGTPITLVPEVYPTSSALASQALD